jgi:thiol:disulfide interchange protein DsbD
MVRHIAAVAGLIAGVGCGSGATGVGGAPEVVERAPAQSGDPQVDPATLVTLSLVASAPAIAPGGSVELAAVYELAAGWHVYWDNPGDAGLRTTAVFSAPAGAALGPVRYPGPSEFLSPGDVRSYGYDERAALFAALTAPADAAGELRLAVKAGWLACRDSCYRGTGTAELVLPVAAAPHARLGFAPAIAALHARLPRPWAELAGARARLSAGALVIAVNAAPLAFFPARQQPAPIADITAQAGRVTVRFGPVPAGAAGEVRGVVRAGDRYYELVLDYPGD